MKIFYDISVLGCGYYHPSAKAGIFRVIENIAYGLKASKECELFFCASESVRHLCESIDYLENNSQFEKIPLVYSNFRSKIGKKLIKFDRQIVSKLNSKKLLLKILRKSLLYVDNFADPYYPIINSQSLKSVDIFHSPFYGIPKQARQEKKVKKFLTVYDLIPILYPHFCDIDVDLCFKNILATLTPDDYIICISQATKNDLCNHIKVDPSKVFVTPLAAASHVFYPCLDSQKILTTKEKYHIPDVPYILSLSTLEPRKNIDHVISCFVKLVQEQNLKDLHLVLVGTKGWKYNKIFEKISNYSFLEKRIIVTGYVADEDLAALYSGALAFVYLSFYEGFGLPPLEAMQCGIPVITSNTSSLPEVVGDAGIMLEPTDIDGLCQSILEIYNRPTLREAMSSKSLEKAKQFSWDKCIQDTTFAYKSSLN